MAGDILKSEWGSLNPILLASLYPVDRYGQPLADEPVVVSPPIEGSVEISANWQSPFESMGPETKAPALMAMLQTGMITSTVVSLTGAASVLLGGTGDRLISSGVNSAADWLDQKFGAAFDSIQGVTGMTKLNSTQVFTGAAPVKIPLTLAFRAFRDTKAEVQDPLDMLAQWALPVDLSVEGSISGAVRGVANALTGNGSWSAVFPSRAPRYLGLKYGGYTFSPLVIESISHPIVTPRASDGGPLQVHVQVSLASVTALDANDWRRARSGLPTRMFTNASPGK